MDALQAFGAAVMSASWVCAGSTERPAEQGPLLLASTGARIITFRGGDSYRAGATSLAATGCTRTARLGGSRRISEACAQFPPNSTARYEHRGLQFPGRTTDTSAESGRGPGASIRLTTSDGTGSVNSGVVLFDGLGNIRAAA